MNSSDACKNVVKSNAVIDNSCKVTSYGDVTMSKIKIVKNLIVLVLTFLLLFCAYQGLANLQSTLNNVGNIGVLSQSLIYAALIVSSLFLPKLVINKIGCKLTIVISVLTYAPYIAANAHPKDWTLLPTAVLLGAGGATLWCSASTYINDLSFLYADREEEKSKLSTPLFFGIFLMFFHTTQIWGNIVSFLVLKPSDSSSAQNSTIPCNSPGANACNISCGANFCGGANEILQHPLEEKIFILIAIYFAFSILSAIVAALFLDKLEKGHKIEKTEDSVILNLLATFNQLKNMDQMLLVVLTTHIGLQLGFLFADYTEAYIACASGLQNIGLVFVCYGTVNAGVCFLGGCLAKYIPRILLMTAAAVCSISVYITLFVWIPSSEQSWIFFVISGFWGFDDAIWETQMNALYGVLFREDEEAAFANYKLWQSMGFVIAYGCSSMLCISAKIWMQIVLLSLGFFGYVIVEYRIFVKEKCYVVNNVKFCR